MRVKSLEITLGDRTREFIVGRLFDGKYVITEIEEFEEFNRGWLIKTEVNGKEAIVATVFSDDWIVTYDVEGQIR